MRTLQITVLQQIADLGRNRFKITPDLHHKCFAILFRVH